MAFSMERSEEQGTAVLWIRYFGRTLQKQVTLIFYLISHKQFR